MSESIMTVRVRSHLKSAHKSAINLQKKNNLLYKIRDRSMSKSRQNVWILPWISNVNVPLTIYISVPEMLSNNHYNADICEHKTIMRNITLNC